ncbi:ATP-NAD kinase-like domain-containing protein [Scheffersomyces amazonensis]|uniref:ATP-NAD kinase-like domain-containing protein n=1 Tax=Scheffersomyces amazonensis TaxID=1078765 RepID=UPI00315CCC91
MSIYQMWRKFPKLIFSSQGTSTSTNPNITSSKIAIRTIMTKNRIRIESISSLKSHEGGKKIIPNYVKTSVLSKLHRVEWPSRLENIYIVKKPWNYNVRDAMIQVIEHLHGNYPQVKIIVNKTVADELWEECNGTKKSNELINDLVIYTGEIEDIVDKTDLIITLGGDGTILRAVSVFSNVIVPPVLSFALGTLGFLLPFDFKAFESTFKEVYENKAQALHRTRLECHLIGKDKNLQSSGSPGMIHAMNDIVLHRGSQPNLTALDIIIDGELLTTTTCDGIVLSTPTGSTAYSLSSGGSITHPSVPCILLTPICPRSLSFRPLILPATSHIIIQINESNRNGAIKLSIDGISQADMKPGDQIHVNSDKTNGGDSANGIWCFARSEHDWTKDINELLGFNSSFRAQKQGHHI